MPVLSSFIGICAFAETYRNRLAFDEVMLRNQMLGSSQTDIYRVSREVKKMQSINDNILTAWYEVDSGRYIDTKYNI